MLVFLSISSVISCFCTLFCQYFWIVHFWLFYVLYRDNSHYRQQRKINKICETYKLWCNLRTLEMVNSGARERYLIKYQPCYSYNPCLAPLCATNTNWENRTWSLLQTSGVKTNRTSFLCINRSGHPNTKLRTVFYDLRVRRHFFFVYTFFFV
jgi:hypothetical protein